MGTPCREKIGSALTALVMVLSAPIPATAQSTGRDYSRDRVASDNRSDTDPAPSKAPKLSITTRDAVGEVGFALPLDIKLVRTPEIVVERIKMLGLPPGVTISDSTNTFSPSKEDDDIDISSWDLSKIQITQINERQSSFLLSVVAIWTPATGGHFKVTSSILDVNFVRGGRDDAVSAGEPRNSEGLAAHIRETAPSTRAAGTVTKRDTLGADVFVPETHVEPVQNSGVTARPAAPAVPDEKPPESKIAALRRSAVQPQPAPQIDPLVERAQGLIRLGDISGARLLLERAQARNAPNATFLLAQTWDPAMLRTLKVRGLRADPDLARRLYAKAAEQERSDERRLAATGR